MNDVNARFCSIIFIHVEIHAQSMNYHYKPVCIYDWHYLMSMIHRLSQTILDDEIIVLFNIVMNVIHNNT